MNSYVTPKDVKAEELFREKCSQLLIPDRIWLETAHVVSLFLPKKTLSNIFYAIKLNDNDIHKYKALCCWLNSTFGLLLVLSNRQETRGVWLRLKLSHWRLQDVLDVSKLDVIKLRKLSAMLDKYKEKEFKRLPLQYDDIDEIRLSFDLEILKILEIDIEKEMLIELYKLISLSFEKWFTTKRNVNRKIIKNLPNSKVC